MLYGPMTPTLQIIRFGPFLGILSYLKSQPLLWVVIICTWRANRMVLMKGTMLLGILFVCPTFQATLVLYLATL